MKLFKIKLSTDKPRKLGSYQLTAENIEKALAEAIRRLKQSNIPFKKVESVELFLERRLGIGQPTRAKHGLLALDPNPSPPAEDVVLAPLFQQLDKVGLVVVGVHVGLVEDGVPHRLRVRKHHRAREVGRDVLSDTTFRRGRQGHEKN